MAELNFKITGDDSDVRKKLANIAKFSKDTNDQIEKETMKSIAAGAKARADSMELARSEPVKAFAFDDSIYSESIAKFKDSIDEQKKIFESYEKWKLTLGKETAGQLLKNQLNATSSTLEKAADGVILATKEGVEGQLKTLNALIKKGDLPAEIVDEITTQVDNLKLILKIGVDKTNLNKLKEDTDEIVKKFNDDKGKGAKPDTKAAVKRLADNQTKESSIPKEEPAKPKSYLDKVKDNFKYLGKDKKTSEVATGLSTDLTKASQGFDVLSGALAGVNEEASYTIGSIGKIVKIGADAAGSVASFATGDIVGGVTKGISAIAGVFSMSKKVKAMNEAARKEVSDFYANAIKGETAYAALLRKRELSSAAKGQNSYKGIIAQLEVLKKQSPELEKAYDSIFASLQGQEYKEGAGSKHGTWLRKAKTWDIMASLSGADYDKMEALDAQGRLSGDAKANFDSLRKLRDELAAAGVATDDLQKQLSQLLTGTTNSGLADGLKSLFENGKNSAQDFGDSFEEIIKKSLISSFKAKILDDAMQPFYDELATMMKNGTPSEEDIEALKNKYIAIGEQASAQLKDIEKVTGKDLTKSGASKNTISGSVQNISASQADVLTESFAGMRLAQFEGNGVLQTLGLNGAQQLSVAMANLDVALKIEANTFKTATNTDRLEKIETSLVSIDSKMSNPDNSQRAAGF